jgi:hypothetical protein
MIVISSTAEHSGENGPEVDWRAMCPIHLRQSTRFRRRCGTVVRMQKWNSRRWTRTSAMRPVRQRTRHCIARSEASETSPLAGEVMHYALFHKIAVGAKFMSTIPCARARPMVLTWPIGSSLMVAFARRADWSSRRKKKWPSHASLDSSTVGAIETCRACSLRLYKPAMSNDFFNNLRGRECNQHRILGDE